MDTNCKAYIIEATDMVTGMFYGYYSKGASCPQTTTCIWFAKFYLTNGKNIKSVLDNLIKKMSYDARTGHDLSWKILEVSMNTPKDI